MVTSWVAMVDRETALAAGADGFLNKNELSVAVIRSEFAPFLDHSA